MNSLSTRCELQAIGTAWRVTSEFEWTNPIASVFTNLSLSPIIAASVHVAWLDAGIQETRQRTIAARDGTIPRSVERTIRRYILRDAWLALAIALRRQAQLRRHMDQFRQ